MGITAKIWPATDDEIRRCSRDPEHVTSMFFRYDASSDDPANARGHALIHGARELGSYLAAHAAAGLGVDEVSRASDPSYTMSATRVRALHAAQGRDPCHALLACFPTQAINHVEIAEVVALAASTGRGLVFCVFEDW